MRLAAVTLLPLMLAGCYQDINLDKYKDQNGEHLLVINSIVNPDSTVAVAATRPYFFSDVHDKRDYVEGLDITLLINGDDCSSLTFDKATGLYRSSVRPAEDDVVELRTVYSGAAVSCSDRVPRAVPIEGVKVTRQGPLSIYRPDSDYVFTYEITFTDPADEANYYFLQYDGDWFSGLRMGERDFTYEYVFQQLANTVNAKVPGWEPYSPYGLPFTDRGIEGQTHTLIVREIVQGNAGIDLSRYTTMPRTIKLFSISEDYYSYLLSVLYNDADSDGLHGGLIDLGIAEPVKYFSNIHGGTGILAAYSLSSTTLDVMTITGPIPPSK